MTQIEHQRFVLVTAEHGISIWLADEMTLATFLLTISEAFTHGFFVEQP